MKTIQLDSFQVQLLTESLSEIQDQYDSDQTIYKELQKIIDKTLCPASLPEQRGGAISDDDSCFHG